MQEEVGYCQKCEKIILCLDGFLNGIIDSDGKLTCFSCDESNLGEKIKGN